MAKDKSINKPDLKTRVSRMFCNESMSDVTFMVDDPPYRFACHKFILGIGSQVFETMFFGKMPERSTIHVPDVTVTGFKIMLKYLYSDVVEIENESDAFETGYVSQKYMVENLFNVCENYLLSNVILSSETVFSIYEEASFLEMRKLKASCLRFVARNAKKILKSKAFLGVSKETLKDIFTMDFMVIDTECELIQALWFWGEEQCKEGGILCSIENIRKFTHDLTKYLRFSSIPPDDLKQILVKCQFADIPVKQDDLFKLTESTERDLNPGTTSLSTPCSSFNTRSIENCSKVNMPTEYRYDGNMSTFLIDEQYQKFILSVSGPDVTLIGFVVAFKPIPCYSSLHRSLELEFLIYNPSKNFQTCVKSILKTGDHSAEEVQQTLMLDDFMVMSEGELCEIMVVILGEGVRILNCIKDKFSSEVGNSLVSFEFSVQDEPISLPVKQILCKPS